MLTKPPTSPRLEKIFMLHFSLVHTLQVHPPLRIDIRLMYCFHLLLLVVRKTVVRLFRSPGRCIERLYGNLSFINVLRANLRCCSALFVLSCSQFS
jgi:hypothetical protein